MSFGSVDKWTIPEEQALPIIKHAFDKGLNTWDTVSTRAFISLISAYIQKLNRYCLGGCLRLRRI